MIHPAAALSIIGAANYQCLQLVKGDDDGERNHCPELWLIMVERRFNIEEGAQWLSLSAFGLADEGRF